MLFDSPLASIPYCNLLCIRAKYRDFIALWGRTCNRTEQNRTECYISNHKIDFKNIRHEDVIEKGANRRLCLVLVRPSER